MLRGRTTVASHVPVGWHAAVGGARRSNEIGLQRTSTTCCLLPCALWSLQQSPRNGSADVVARLLWEILYAAVW